MKTQKEIKKMNTLYAKGYSLRQVAKKIGCSKSTVKKYVDFDPSRHTHRSMISKDLVNLAKKMRAKGATYKEIAQWCGCSFSTARTHTKSTPRGDRRDFANLKPGKEWELSGKWRKEKKEREEFWKAKAARDIAEQIRKKLDLDCLVLLLIAMVVLYALERF